MNDVIKLVTITQSTNDYGDIVRTSVEREVFAEMKSVGQREFYEAQSKGFKAEIKFVLADYLDYQGETVIKYAEYDSEEQAYSVIRTYRNGTQLEITCKRGLEDANT